ncbi:MAG TPA: hypothetical protein DC049_09250 [Spirochaetia bacterium]|nr:hypothetical protein [Spirochaetia bacterium]
MNVLIAEDDQYCRQDLSDVLQVMGHNVKSAASGMEALGLLKAGLFDILLSDVDMPELSGLELVKIIKALALPVRIILVSGKADIIASMNALGKGAFDFMVKPVSVPNLEKILSDASAGLSGQSEILEQGRVDIDRVFRQSGNSEFIFCSEKMRQVRKKIERLREYPEIPALLCGASGTGKEIAAKFIHGEHTSDRPFIGVNIASLNSGTFEAELFGYKAGSFTGADPAGSRGKINAASGGTLFLDEISEIPLAAQAKLLRVIEAREYFPVGSDHPCKTSCRFLFSTNRDLPGCVSAGAFRQDLYYRISQVIIELPPVSERREDLIPLAASFILKLNNTLRRDVKYISGEARELLESHTWTGNIRELKNVITEAMLFSEGQTLLEHHLMPFLLRCTLPQNENNNSLLVPGFNLEIHNQKLVDEALGKCSGNKSEAAKMLGITRRKLYSRFRVI